MLVPVPVKVVPPGYLVSVHEPVEGSPLNTTLPVAKEEVGWVMVPTTGADGPEGFLFITTMEDAAEIHFDVFVTVKVKLPAARPVTV